VNDPTLPNTAGSIVPAVLLPYQREWIADTSALKVMEKGRRTGITWGEAADDVLIAAQDKSSGGQNVYYIGTDKDMTEEYIEACAMWARQFNRAAGQVEEGIWGEGEDDKFIKTFTIRFPGSGHRITALASRPRKLRGRQGILIGDEAAFQDSLPELLKAALAFLVWGGKVRLISTHDGEDNAFNDVIQEIRAGKRRGTVHRVPFQDAVDQGLYERVCLRLGKPWSAEEQVVWVREIYEFYGDDAAEELDCIPSQGGGAFLTMGMIESRMSRDTPIVRMRWRNEFAYEPEAFRVAEVRAWCVENLLPHLQALEPKLAHGFGEDFARLGDLTVISVFEESADLIDRVRLIVELGNCPYRQQEQILFFIVDHLPRFRSGALDATGNGGYLAEAAMQKYGTARIEAVTLNDRFYLENMPRFKAAFEDGTLTDIPRDSEIRDDLRALRKIDGVPKLPKAKTQKSDDGKKLQRHGDAAIALFLGHYAMKREVALIEFEGTGQRRVGFGLEAMPEAARISDAGFGGVRGGNDFAGW
jgi:phage FluMu gp28-like protein